jgi:hypothetical protein
MLSAVMSFVDPVEQILWSCSPQPFLTVDHMLDVDSANIALLHQPPSNPAENQAEQR